MVISTVVTNNIRWMLVMLLFATFSSTLMARQHITMISLPGTSGSFGAVLFPKETSPEFSGGLSEARAR